MKKISQENIERENGREKNILQGRLTQKRIIEKTVCERLKKKTEEKEICWKVDFRKKKKKE